MFEPWTKELQYLETKAKCHLKNLPVKGLYGRGVSEFTD